MRVCVCACVRVRVRVRVSLPDRSHIKAPNATACDGARDATHAFGRISAGPVRVCAQVQCEERAARAAVVRKTRVAAAEVLEYRRTFSSKNKITSLGVKVFCAFYDCGF